MKKLLLLIALTLPAIGQDALTNESISKMVKAGLGESLIVSMIQSQPGKYTLTADDLVRLKTEGVSEKILAAMIAKGTAGPAAKSDDQPDTDIPQNPEIGAYYKKSGKWQELLPEVVNWKTGGALKSVATVGIVKGDVNGHLEGLHSKNSAASPVEVFIYAPEGVAITEYQLIRMRAQKESREFRTVTGGVLHASGGATRDLVSFDGKKVSNRMFKVVLPSLGAGEYGFLPPGSVTSGNGASIGKIYTFRLLE